MLYLCQTLDSPTVCCNTVLSSPPKQTPVWDWRRIVRTPRNRMLNNSEEIHYCVTTWVQLRNEMFYDPSVSVTNQQVRDSHRLKCWSNVTFTLTSVVIVKAEPRWTNANAFSCQSHTVTELTVGFLIMLCKHFIVHAFGTHTHTRGNVNTFPIQWF